MEYRPAGEPRCRTAARSGDPSGLGPGFERKHSLLGSGRTGVPRRRRNHRSLAPGFPRRSFFESPGAGCLRPCAIRNVKRKTTPYRRSQIARLRRGSLPRPTNSQLGIPGPPRYYWTDLAPRFRRVAKLVQPQRGELESSDPRQPIDRRKCKSDLNRRGGWTKSWPFPLKRP